MEAEAAFSHFGGSFAEENRPNKARRQDVSGRKVEVYSINNEKSQNTTKRPVKQQPNAVKVESQQSTAEGAAKASTDDMCRSVIVERYDGGDGSTLLETSKNCVHECVRPVNYVRKPKVERPPAKQFSYTLDPFQKAAVDCLESGESVLVAAHTSAGKTTVAEYAIAMALRDGSRVVYTSPIKALSNQKYRDLAEQFGDVGLMTGDVTLNPNSSVIIMTTEILRSILYRGSELVREVRWVVFDEIHYMRDRERGVVWEESIILLPDSVRQVFLSATIPNALEFAEWICRVKHQPCHVISTNYRPTPLQHFIYPSGSDGVLMVMDEKRNFKEDNFRTALNKLKMANEDDHLPKGWQPLKRRKQSQGNAGGDLAKIIGMCHQREYIPVIVFAFSKLEVEENAAILEKADLTDQDEKSSIEQIFSNAVATLAEEDQHLPQIGAVLPMLMRGIGIHHGGLLPIVKEITELLFQEMLIKVLFSTETFSMGINMPAKTVIFSALEKWDGQRRRMISPGEYIQMSGRAGRRGLDARGLSIVMVPPQADPDELKALFTGEPLRLDSHFYLKYNTLLNLLRVDGADPQYMLQRSFHQFQREKHTISLEEDKRKMEIELANQETIAVMVEDVATKVGRLRDEVLPPALRSANTEELEMALGEFVACVQQIKDLKREIAVAAYGDNRITRYLQKGRIIHIVDGDMDWGYGVVLAIRHARMPSGQPELVIDVLLECEEGRVTPNSPLKLGQAKPTAGGVLDALVFGLPPSPINENTKFEIFPVTRNALLAVTAILLKGNDQPRQRADEFRATMGRNLHEFRRRVKDVQLLDPTQDVDGNHPVVRLAEDYAETLDALRKNPFYGWQYAKEFHRRFDQRVQLETSLRQIESQLQMAKSPKAISELKGMEEVLRRLKYVDENNVVTFKGRIACDVSTVDELIIGEMLFDNALSELGVEHLCAMLSCLVHEDKPSDKPPEDTQLAQLHEQVRSVARKIAETSIASRLEMNADDYVKKFDSSLMKATYMWMKSESFSNIVKETTAYEGSIVRSFRRLEEMLRDLASAAKAMGSANLEAKFLDAIKVLKRGIIFAASLYL